MRLGDVMRVKRNRLDMCLRDVATATGLSISYVSDIEHGRRTCPPRTAARLALALGEQPERFVQMVLADDLEGLNLEVVVRKKLRGVP